MGLNASAALLEQIRQLATVSGSADVPDRELLERFAVHHDEAAFTALLARHGPMVIHVCRRVLPRPQDAEDAFQTTFLVLAQKARSVRRRESAAAWLHGTAYRVALKARTTAARRQARERRAEPAPAAPDPVGEISLREAQVLLHEQLSRLPERLRAPLVLCYLQGATQDEAARRLGWSLNTLKRRLNRGRQVLHARLGRSGVALPAVLGAGLLTHDVASAALRAATVRAALLATARAGTFVGRVAAVVALTRAKLLAGVMLALGLVAAGALTSNLGHEGPAPVAPPAGAVQPAADPAVPFFPGPPRCENDKPGTDRFGDPLPDGAVTRLGTIRFRPGSWVYKILFLPDGRTLLSVGWGDGAIQFWDRATGKLLRRLPADKLSGAVALSPDGKTLAAGGLDKDVRLWDLDSGKEKAPLRGHQGEIKDLAFSPDGRLLASGGDDKTVCLWDVATGKEVRQLGGHDGRVHAVVFSPDGKHLASAVNRSTTNRAASLHLWDVATGRERRRIPVATGVVYPLFAPDSRAVLASNGTGKVPVWDVTTGELLRHFEAPASIHVNRLFAFSPDGKTLAAGAIGEGRQMFPILLWDAATGKEVKRLAGPVYLAISGAFSPDGRVLATASVAMGMLQLWDVTTGKAVVAPEGHEAGVSRVAFSPEGKLVATASDVDPTVRLWDRRSGQLVRTFRGQRQRLTALAYSSTGRALATCGWGEGIRVWDPATGKELWRLDIDTGYDGALAYSPDGKILATAGANQGSVRLLDAATGRPLRLLDLDRASPACTVAFAPDGKVLATGHQDYSVRLWDPATGRPLSLPAEWNKDLPKKNSTHASSVAFSPDGRTLAIIRPEKAVGLWEVTTGRARLRLPAPKDEITSLVFAPDGRALATTDLDAINGVDGSLTLRLWDAFTGRQLSERVAHGGRTWALAFSLDGKQLATGGGDTTALLWDVAALTGRPKSVAVELSENERLSLWADLAGEDVARAYQAVGRLAACPTDAVALFRQKLRAAAEADPQRVAPLLTDLSSATFAVREKALQELIKLGEPAAPALRRVLQDKETSLEFRRRVEQALAKTAALSAERVREVRAVEALERAGTAAARDLLEALARGNPEARLTREAQGSVEHLARRRTGP
jgi:RNA polymerase sigma factor (sigma-70 family)